MTRPTAKRQRDGKRPAAGPRPRKPTYEELLARVERQERQWQRALLDSLPDDVFFVNADGEQVFANQAARESLGVRDPADVRGVVSAIEAQYEVLKPDGSRRAPGESPFIPALRGETVRGEELVRNRGTGALRHRAYQVRPVLLDGEIVGAVSTVRDVTEHKRAEEALQRQTRTLEAINRVFQEALTWASEAQLGSACLSVAMGLTQSAAGFIAELDPQTGRLDDLACSGPAWEARRRTDLELQGLCGQVLRDGKPFLANQPCSREEGPQGAPALRALLGIPLLKAGRAVGMIGLANREGGYRDDDVRAVESLGLAILQALQSMRNDAALRRSEERWELLSRSASRLLATENPQAVVDDLCTEVMRHLDCQMFFNYLVDEPSRRLHLNACAGIPAEEARRIEWLDYGVAVCGCVARDGRRIVAEDIQRSGDVRTDLVRSYGAQVYCCHPLKARGRSFGTLSFGATNRPRFRDDEIELMRIVCDQVAMAMERMKAAEELRVANAGLAEVDRRKNEFLGVLSHELRNPLAPIRNSLYILERAAPGGEQAGRAHAVIDRQVAHLTRLVDDLLDVTRITRGKIRLLRTRLDLAGLFRRTLEDHRSVLEGRQVEVSWPADPVWVDGDPTRLAQVLGNLLQNAAKFTPEDERIGVALALDGGQAVLEVADSGMGIDPETLRMLFEPFAQADRSLDRSKGGLGLGLAIVKGMVELHGGRVSAHSDGPGRGSRFTVRLPLGGGEAPAARRRPQGRGQARRVLLVEDNQDAARSLAEVLALGGHEVSLAFDGRGGLAQAFERPPEVVLCDIGLPAGMDGYAVGRALRGDARTASCYLVALTGYAQPEDRRRALEAGFDAHLAKPPDLAELERILQEAGCRCPAGEVSA